MSNDVKVLNYEWLLARNKADSARLEEQLAAAELSRDRLTKERIRLRTEYANYLAKLS